MRYLHLNLSKFCFYQSCKDMNQQINKYLRSQFLQDNLQQVFIALVLGQTLILLLHHLFICLYVLVHFFSFASLLHEYLFVQVFGSPLEETDGGYVSVTQPIKRNNYYSSNIIFTEQFYYMNIRLSTTSNIKVYHTSWHHTVQIDIDYQYILHRYLQEQGCHILVFVICCTFCSYEHTFHMGQMAPILHLLRIKCNWFILVSSDNTEEYN